MNEKEYYEMPYGVCDRLELQRFLTVDHYEGAVKIEAQNTNAEQEPETQKEMFRRWIFELTHNR